MEAILDKIPNAVTTFFAAIGVIFLGSKVLSYVQLLLSLFVLSGKNVRSLYTALPLQPPPNTPHSFDPMDPKAPGQ